LVSSSQNDVKIAKNQLKKRMAIVQNVELKKSFEHFALNRAKKRPFCGISERSF
jgi:hypothetical protein